MFLKQNLLDVAGNASCQHKSNNQSEPTEHSLMSTETAALNERKKGKLLPFYCLYTPFTPSWIFQASSRCIREKKWFKYRPSSSADPSTSHDDRRWFRLWSHRERNPRSCVGWVVMYEIQSCFIWVLHFLHNTHICFIFLKDVAPISLNY